MKIFTVNTSSYTGGGHHLASKPVYYVNEDNALIYFDNEVDRLKFELEENCEYDDVKDNVIRCANIGKGKSFVYLKYYLTND